MERAEYSQALSLSRASSRAKLRFGERRGPCWSSDRQKSGGNMSSTRSQIIVGTVEDSRTRRRFNDLAGRNEAGNGGTQPRRGIARPRFCALQKNHIGSVDPDALKIPARRSEYSLAESALSPLQAEPTQLRLRASRKHGSQFSNRLGCRLRKSSCVHSLIGLPACPSYWDRP